MPGATIPSRAPAGKLSPTAYDRWWRDRIVKEEGNDPKQGATAATHSKAAVSTLADVMAHTAVDHLVGAGALVAPKATPATPNSLNTYLTGAGHAQHTTIECKPKAPSVVSSAARSKLPSDMPVSTPRDSNTAGQAASQAGVSQAGTSQASYPKTPCFSKAGAGSVTDSTVMSRLVILEQELLRERAMREAAQREMKELLTKAAGQA